MITKNFETLLATALQATDSIPYGMLPVTDLAGQIWYKASHWGVSVCPAVVADTPTLDPNADGVSVGTGDTAPTPFDRNLESTLTSGVSLSMAAVVPGVDPPANPFVRYHLTVTNTSSAPVTVREVGYKQALRVLRRPGMHSTASGIVSRVFLLDRTVLEEPVTIAPGDAGVIHYKLRTIAAPERSVGGVPIVSWTWGTDAQIAAMLDAAHAGVLDLQEDAHWRVGDLRMVPVAAFSSPSVSHAAQTIAVAVSDFAGYNGCGNVAQLDFYDTTAFPDRMNADSANVGGYAGSEMYRYTLPALAGALPAWLRSRLRPFDVRVAAGSGSGVIETVGDNLLALRSEAEVFGLPVNSYPGEGSPVALYRTAVNIRKVYGGGTSDTSDWWLRSPDTATTRFCRVSRQGTPTASTVTTSGIAAFGCV